MLLDNLSTLYPGQPIVHLEHGVGRYIGLISLTINNIEAEYLILSYADDDKLYVPITSIHLISRYSVDRCENIPLHKLGTDNWLRARKNAAKKIRDAVAELLDIYSQRATKTGFAFKNNYEQYLKFCAEFQFNTTPDQKHAIDAVLNDMYKPVTMDRLICGDVGFGKTEIAMRAAFIAVKNNKQVAVLVPTTLLAQQHYDNFCKRFANYQIRIGVLSRFLNIKEQHQVLKQATEGKIDILISTHKLLMNNLKWHDLGLLIVDEEHRFGVRHKELIKGTYTNVDILTLTATPIPRTLNMAMSGIRDLSIIATPPVNRLAVKTFVRRYDKSVIRDAILKEILRGGQIYYLYNNVKHIEKIAYQLARLVPEARVAIGHGQMREHDLEKVISDFQHHRFNVLVCTTIIETGIDIPNVNTIIIENSNQFGLAQLHQLRGRVGRSHQQAYALLLTPHPKKMTTDAQRRLQAIASYEDLGAGFALATHDLEIRGAGELLGEDQSGQIETIGYALYMQLLKNAINALKIGKEPSLKDLISNKTEIELHIPTLLPKEFVSDVNVRLSFYKRIASAKNQLELNDIKIEIINRFGDLPIPVKNLFDISEMRLIAHFIGISKIEINGKGGFFEFLHENQVNLNWLINLIKNDPKRWKLQNPLRLKFTINLTDDKSRIQWLRDFISKISNNCV
ncbi:transcription-repair coupling factor [Pantoea sp. Mhis]|nr:transcription-repair coupling factor [Pantoea sp. Mhis]